MSINDFLPFDISPTVRFAKVGNERVGVIRFPEEGSLRASEDKRYQDMLAEQPDAFPEIAKIAVEISKSEEGLRPSEAYKAIVETQSEEFADIRLKYAEKIVGLNASLNKVIKFQQLAAVTAIMPRLAEVSGATAEQIALFSNWEIEQTLQLSGGLIEEIYKFFQKEANRGKEPGAEILTDEDIKKPPAEESQPSQEQTGQISIGASADTGPAKIDSSQNASAGVR